MEILYFKLTAINLLIMCGASFFLTLRVDHLRGFSEAIETFLYFLLINSFIPQVLLSLVFVIYGLF